MAKVNPRLISLKVAAVDRSDEMSKFRLKSAKSDTDFLTFAASRAGGDRDYIVTGTIAQDHVAGTLWDLMWSSPGTEATAVYAPYGNTTPSATQPHYSMTVIISEPDGDFMGADSNISPKAVATVDIEWVVKTKPTKLTA